MNKDEFLQEMMSEVKSFEDLVKEETPLLAKEYIRYYKITNFLWTGVFFVLLLTAIGCGFWSYNLYQTENDLVIPASMYAAIMGFFSTLALVYCVDNLISLYLQPRRMAIKAIASVARGED